MSSPPPTSTAAETRELAARRSGGVHVLLLWHPLEDALTVSVEDSRTGDRFQVAVARDRALDAFHHPFAYAAAESDVVPLTTQTGDSPAARANHSPRG